MQNIIIMALTEIQKFEIIAKYNGQKMSIKKISQQMNINRHTVSLWVKRYAESKNLERKQGSGIRCDK